MQRWNYALCTMNLFALIRPYIYIIIYQSPSVVENFKFIARLAIEMKRNPSYSKYWIAKLRIDGQTCQSLGVGQRTLRSLTTTVVVVVFGISFILLFLRFSSNDLQFLAPKISYQHGCLLKYMNQPKIARPPPVDVWARKSDRRKQKASMKARNHLLVTASWIYNPSITTLTSDNGGKDKYLISGRMSWQYKTDCGRLGKLLVDGQFLSLT